MNAHALRGPHTGTRRLGACITSAPQEAPTRPASSPHRTPVPTSAHPSPRAIRVHRSPR